MSFVLTLHPSANILQTPKVPEVTDDLNGFFRKKRTLASLAQSRLHDQRERHRKENMRHNAADNDVGVAIVRVVARRHGNRDVHDGPQQRREKQCRKCRFNLS